MSISDDAYNGLLTLSKLKDYHWADPGCLDGIGGAIDLTPLCAACLGGHLQIVKHLLSCGADPNIPSAHECTPLFFVTDPTSKAAPATRCAIIRELVSGKNRRKRADIDKACNDDKNTALMNVLLELKDPEVIRQLVMSGASLTLTHYAGQSSAKELAEEYGLSSYLESKADKDAAWAKLIDLIVSFTLLAIAYANNETMNRVVGGVVKKYYDLSVKQSDLPKGLLKKVEGKTIEEFEVLINEELKQNPKFEKFFAPHDPFIKALAENALALRDDDTTDLGNPDNIGHLMCLSLYHPVIYCDDSGSMSQERRYEDQTELVTRIARIVTKIVPDNMAGADLRFINSTFSGTLDVQQIQQTMQCTDTNGGTMIGSTLRERILKPLVYDVINEPNLLNSSIPFRRPLLVCVITDGAPNIESLDTFCNEIVLCKRQLEAKGYDPASVMFCISQVGTDEAAEDFLDRLRNTEEIQDVIYCTVGRLEEKYKELKENQRALESWLLHVLAKPIVERHMRT